MRYGSLLVARVIRGRYSVRFFFCLFSLDRRVTRISTNEIVRLTVIRERHFAGRYRYASRKSEKNKNTVADGKHVIIKIYCKSDNNRTAGLSEGNIAALAFALVFRVKCYRDYRRVASLSSLRTESRRMKDSERFPNEIGKMGKE